jgi:hypothetical protein
MSNKLIFVFWVMLFIACDQTLEISLTGQRVALAAPVNNLVTKDTIQTFFWQKIDGALEYQLQIVSPRFDSIARLIRDTIISTNKFTMDMESGVYQWRVKASNHSSESAISETWNLVIQ